MAYPVRDGNHLIPTMLKSILTDLHFWLPVVVLLLGVTLLAALR